jgi:hypothetical protein
MRENLVNILTGKAKSSTKWLFSLLLGLPVLMQIPAFEKFVAPLLSAHPKVATFVGSLVAIGTLLHDPKVRSILGIVQETTITQSSTVVTDGSSQSITKEQP